MSDINHSSSNETRRETRNTKRKLQSVYEHSEISADRFEEKRLVSPKPSTSSIKNEHHHTRQSCKRRKSSLQNLSKNSDFQTHQSASTNYDDNAYEEDLQVRVDKSYVKFVDSMQNTADNPKRKRRNSTRNELLKCCVPCTREEIYEEKTLAITQDQKLPKLFIKGIPLLYMDDIHVSDIKLAEGTHSRVQLGRLNFLPRTVVLKISKPHICNKLIIREAASHKKLESSGIVPHLHGLVQAPVGCHWIAMEYVKYASTLQKYIPKANLTAASALKLCLEIAKCLQKIHVLDILHNDLKEDNILVEDFTTEFNIKIIDFGLATDLCGRNLSRSANEKTLPHMAPELFSHCMTSKCTDVFSLWRLMKIISYYSNGVPNRNTMERYTGITLPRSLEKTIQILEEELLSNSTV